MRGRIRELGVVALAALALGALALGAVGASAASAEGPSFTAEEYPAFAHGESASHVFEATGIETQCGEATFEAELTGPSQALTVAPTYTDCTGFFGVSVTITGFGDHGEEDTCDYLLHTETEQTNPAGATVDIVCEGDAEVTIDSNPCTVHIPPQEDLQTIALTNDTPGSGKVRADIDVEGITGEITRNNFLCPTHGGHFDDGTYEGTLDVEGEDSSGNPIELDLGTPPPVPEHPTFTADEYPAFAHGASSGHLFEATGISIGCATATFETELAAASETLTVEPTYTGCSWFFGSGLSVTGFGHYSEEDTCDFLLHTETEQTNPAGATVDIVCEGDAEITIESSPCTIHIPAQKGLGTVTLTNDTPSPGAVRADINVGGIHGTMTKNNFLCLTHPGTFTNGTYTGALDLEGENAGGEAIDIDVG